MDRLTCLAISLFIVVVAVVIIVPFPSPCEEFQTFNFWSSDNKMDSDYIQEEPKKEENNNKTINQENKKTEKVETKKTIKEENKSGKKENNKVKKEDKNNKEEKIVKEEKKPLPKKEEHIEITTRNDDYFNTSKIFSNNVLVWNDGSFIPDRYNTGINPNSYLNTFYLGQELLHFKVVASADNTAVINFYHEPNKQPGTYVIENMDFSNYYFRIYDHDVPGNINIIFRNCKFGKMGITPELNDKIHFQFENCQFGSFYGSNSDFYRCKFGHGTGDALVLFKNANIHYSFIADLTAFISSGELHLDGVQIYGKEEIPAENIHFYNTRFETPAVLTVENGQVSRAYVNAPIMVALEYNNANNITFENIWLNGGGYSLYSGVTNGFSYSNIVYRNIYAGYGHMWGGIKYPNNKYEGVYMENVGYYDKLIIGSVWKDSEGVHISTSNDTLVQRELTIVTDKGTFTYTVNAHPKITRETQQSYSYKDLPYDINVLIKSTSISYIKCYDTTNIKELTDSNLLKAYSF